MRIRDILRMMPTIRQQKDIDQVREIFKAIRPHLI